VPTTEIAERLRVSPRTVDMHRARLRKRLAATSSAEIVRLVLAGRADTEPA